MQVQISPARSRAPVQEPQIPSPARKDCRDCLGQWAGRRMGEWAPAGERGWIGHVCVTQAGGCTVMVNTRRTQWSFGGCQSSVFRLGLKQPKSADTPPPISMCIVHSTVYTCPGGRAESRRFVCLLVPSFEAIEKKGPRLLRWSY
jgi:hypothetical protein